MKTMKLLKLAALMVPALLFFGCASTKAGKDFSPYAPMALVSVVSNYDINWAGEKTVEKRDAVSSFVRKTLQIKNDDTRARISRADELINSADSILRDAISEAKIFRLEDKNVLSNSTAYINAEQAKLPKSPVMITANGYKPLNYRNKNFASELAQETGIQSVLYITFTFTKEMVSGIGKNGNCRAKVIMSAILVDTQGKIIYRRDIETHSQDKIEVKDGFYTHEDLIELFKEAIGEACYRFVWYYTGTPDF